MPRQSRMSAMKTAAPVEDEFDSGEDQEVAEIDGAPTGADRDTLVAITGLNTASDNQINIFAEFAKQIENYRAKTQTSSIAVQAVAGSGKTTTIVAAAKLIPRNMKAMFLAFNKSIADELGARLPRHVEAKTLNALGFGLLRPYLNGLGIHKVRVNGGRTNAIIRKELTFPQQDEFGKDIRFLVGMCKSMGVVPVNCTDGVGVNGMEATDDVLMSICLHHSHMIDPVIRPTVFAKTRIVLERSFSDANIAATQTIDYDDQKWLTVCKRPNGRTLAKPQVAVAIVDEVQDVNDVDIAMIRMILLDNGIVIGVGDENQAIYGFRGADTEAFGNFVTSFDATRLPLDITYRCGVALVLHAQELVPSIKAAPNAQEGAVDTLNMYDADTFKPQDLILCRNNAPLIDFAYGLIRARKPVFVKGRSIGDGLIRLIEDCVAEKKWIPNPDRPGKKKPILSVDNASVMDLQAALYQWEAQQSDMIRQEDPDNEAAIQRIEDQAASVRIFMESNTDGLVSSVVNDIRDLFSDADNEDAVVCATIHKAKGLEADRVFLYGREYLYPGFVRRGTWQFDQEKHLDYVARTRGKSYYAYLSTDGMKQQ